MEIRLGTYDPKIFVVTYLGIQNHNRSICNIYPPELFKNQMSITNHYNELLIFRQLCGLLCKKQMLNAIQSCLYIYSTHGH